MKNLKIWSLALALLVAMVGCEKPASEQQDEKPVIDAPFKAVSTDKLPELIVGSWQLVEYAGQPAEFDVYIEFTADAFDLYERIYGYEYLYNTGTYTLSGDKLTGVYANGDNWNNEYTIKIAEKPLRLRLIEANGAYAEYLAEEIPAHIKAVKPETPETPETPDTPENPENPENPEQTSTRAYSYFL